jgi:hypothetical protein
MVQAVIVSKVGAAVGLIGAAIEPPMTDALSAVEERFDSTP